MSITETSIPLAPADPAVIAALVRIGDAIFSLKNTIKDGNAALLKALTADEEPAAGSPLLVPIPATGSSTGTLQPATETSPPAAPSAVIATGQSRIQVGPTRTITEPADALAYLAPGGTILLDDGRYLKPFHNTVPGLILQSNTGFPRRCVMDGQGGSGAGHRLAYDKGMIHSSLPISISRVGFANCGGITSDGNHSNEAAIWLGDSGSGASWEVSVTECTFDNCGDAIFTSAEANLKLIVAGNIFGAVSPNGMNAAAAGLDNHAAHDIYFQGHEVVVKGNSFYGGVGHAVKTRCDVTTVQDNPVMCADGGRVLDACEGGTVVFSGNTCWTRTDRAGQAIGSNSGAFGNANLAEYALENANHGTVGATFSKNIFHITRAGSTIAAGLGSTITCNGDIANVYQAGSLNLQGNVVGLQQVAVFGGPPAIPAPPAWAA